MAPDFGTGPTLREACIWLQDDRARRVRILDVTERDSVIEGLPPFTPEIRARFMSQLEALDAQSQGRGG